MALDPGWAGIIGAVAGATISVVVPLIGAWISEHRSRKLADKRRARLRAMLNGEKFKWRSLQQLSASIGADAQTTLELLIEIDARASMANHNSWALIERAPWPPDIQPE